MVTFLDAPGENMIPRFRLELKLHHFYVLRWKKNGEEIILKLTCKAFGTYLFQRFKRRIISNELQKSLSPFVRIGTIEKEWVQMTHQDYLEEFDHLQCLDPDQVTSQESLKKLSEDFKPTDAKF